MSEDFILSDFLPYRLAVLSERMSRRLSVEYGRTHGLSVAEWRVLVHLQRCGQVSIRDIHTCVNLEKPRVSRAVARLEDIGLVRKIPGETDKRLVSISLSREGQEALHGILPKARDFELQLKQSVTSDDFARFSAVLERLHEALDADPEAPPRPSIDRQAAPKDRI
ncbi:MarR family winged helix-turn-helix transcriptional regulator [Marivita geojedonensis]|uniref:HTH marR-type domain-containing protein n=1 Tax=Marivita geojedonensis TaxID=1123756 RepID=A0A1X4NHV5_9RHOB|nr:MarR family transcriptional regulator [Marivita geojedonensis]OSQ47562.1 hypothetical protein MGEO_15660 [Marivita geojedonensis]PRY74550.1 DNA-binding MarR family transcriptional regulator [Marivita geojedonensis]